MVEHLDTPVLLLDQVKLERNIKDIVQFSKEHQLNYRPHIKTHKSIHIAKKQIDYGAIGITVATVGEAEIMSNGGIEDILIAYPIATKLDRVKKLMKQSKITIAVDSIEQVKRLDHSFKNEKHTLDVWIKVNSGLNRCGVQPANIKDLASFITDHTLLNLTGIFTHAGHSYAATSIDELETIAKQEADAVIESAKICEGLGIKIPHRSIGSTPTYQIAGKVPGITEIRPGNAVFFDMVQVGLKVATVDQCALTVMASVGSIHSNRMVIDAGSKTLNLDKGAHGNESVKGYGYIKEYPELIIKQLSEEHGIIPINDPIELNITDQLTIIPNHACTVANLFDYYTVHHNGQIIDQWKVDARGKVN